MDALFFHDGDPCPCCGEPINLSKSSTIDAVNGLSRETEDIYASLIDAELAKYSPGSPAYSVRRRNLIAALGIK